jgi:hypothetical protein
MRDEARAIKALENHARGLRLYAAWSAAPKEERCRGFRALVPGAQPIGLWQPTQKGVA